MAGVLAIVAAAFLLTLAVGAVTGRARSRTVVAATVRHDLRLRSCLDEGNDLRPRSDH
jgi:hypothetical protein